MMSDVGVILFLACLECILSMDNAIVLALLVRNLPKEQRQKALTYGIWGAFIFRIVTLFFITHLMSLNWIKYVGGAYLLYIAANSLFFKRDEGDQAEPGGSTRFWSVVLSVELMDIAFSVDSILAAVSVSQKYSVVLIGGVIGIVAMRFAASMFCRLLEARPALERTAYVLVAIIGTKLCLQGYGIDFHDARTGWSWGFWGSMIATITVGLLRKPKISYGSGEWCTPENVSFVRAEGKGGA